MSVITGHKRRSPDHVQPETDNASNYAFGQHAADWWDPAGPLRTLHAINPVRLEYIDRHCPIAGKQVLDLGCGGGLLCEAMARHGARVSGADTDASLISTAAEHARSGGLAIDYHQATSDDLISAGHGGRYDVVVCLEMLEHVVDPGAVIADCARLLRPGGDLVLSTINRTPAAYAFAIIGAEYVAGLLPRGTHDYEQFIRPAELAAACRASDLSVTDISGMAYIPWLNKAMLCRSTAINYLLHARLRS